MAKYLFAPLLARKLAEDHFFRALFARLLTALAAVAAVGTVILFFLGWKEIFDMTSEAMVGGIVFQLSLVLAGYQAVHATLMRAGEIRRDSGRSAPIVVSTGVLRLVGEAWGIAGIALGIGAGVFTWFAGRETHVLLKMVAFLFPFLEAGPASFAGGATLIVQGVSWGSLALLLGYLGTELLLLLPAAGAGSRVFDEER